MTPKSASVAERAAAGEVGADTRQGLFDVVLDNPQLAAALDRRQKAKEKLRPVTKAYREADAAARGLISGVEEFGWVEPDGDTPLTLRVGSYRVRIAPSKSRSVSFVTEPSLRTTISLLPE